MKLHALFASCMGVLWFVTFTSCSKDRDDSEYNLFKNQPPVAHAGLDQFIVLLQDSTELKGSGIDMDGFIESYAWTKVAGPVSYSIDNNHAAVIKVKNLIEGVYEFELTVVDNGGAYAKDKVTITVMTSSGDPCLGCCDY